MESSSIYITREGQTYGPYAPDKARQMLASGELSKSDLAWVGGTYNWLPLGDLLQGMQGASLPAQQGGDRSKWIKVMAVLALVCAGVAGAWIFKGGGEADDEGNGKSAGTKAQTESPKKTSGRGAATKVPEKLPAEEGLDKIAKIVEFDSVFFGASKGLAVLSVGLEKGLVAGADLLVCRDGKVLGRMKVTRAQRAQSVAMAVNPLDPDSLQVGDEIAFDTSKIAGWNPVEKIVLARHLPDEPGMMMSVKLGKLLELIRRHPMMRNMSRSVSRVPVFGTIMGGIERGNIRVSQTNPALMWMKQIPSTTGGDPDLMVCIMLPIEGGLEEMEGTLWDMMARGGQQISQHQREGFSLLKTSGSPAGVVAFGKGRFVLTAIMDAAKQPLPAVRFTGAEGDRLLKLQSEVLDLAFHGRETSGTSGALADFGKNLNDAEVYMDFSRLPADVIDSEAAFESLSGSTLIVGAGFEQGAISLDLAIYNTKFQDTTNRLSTALLQAFPEDSIAMSGVSVGVKTVAAFFNNLEAGKPISENGPTIVVAADDLAKFAKLLKLPQETQDSLAIVNQFSITGNFEQGKQVYQLECRFKDTLKNGLITLAELTAPAAAVARGRLMSNGTGFFITEDGLLVTNYHVVENGAHFTVQVESGKELPAELIKLNPANDLALLKVKGNFSPLPLRTSDETELGDSVLTMGFPAINIQGREPKLTEGMISSMKGMRDDKRFFQISVPVQPGNSGGALVDEFGNVVGVVTARLNDEAVGFVAQNVNYAVKSSVLLSFLKNVPGLATKLPSSLGKDDKRTKRDVIRSVKDGKVLVLVYGR